MSRRCCVWIATISAEATSVTISAAARIRRDLLLSSLFSGAAGAFLFRLSANFFSDELKSSAAFFSGLGRSLLPDPVPAVCGADAVLLAVRLFCDTDELVSVDRNGSLPASPRGLVMKLAGLAKFPIAV